MSRLTRDGTAEPVSRDQILRHARGQGDIHFPCSADHEQDWQPCPVDPYSAICDDHTYIHTYSSRSTLRVWEISVGPVDLHTLISSVGTTVVISSIFGTQDGDCQSTIIIYRSLYSSDMCSCRACSTNAQHSTTSPV